MQRTRGGHVTEPGLWIGAEFIWFIWEKCVRCLLWAGPVLGLGVRLLAEPRPRGAGSQQGQTRAAGQEQVGRWGRWGPSCKT